VSEQTRQSSHPDLHFLATDAAEGTRMLVDLIRRFSEGQELMTIDWWVSDSEEEES
jgi:hypothetical protein